MNKAIIALLSTLMSLSLFAATEGEVQDALRVQNCLAKFKLEISEYKKIPSYYLKTDEDKRPLETVFQEIQKMEEDYFKTLNEWRASYNKEAKDLSELGVLISSLDKESPLATKLNDLLKNEEKLLRLIHLHTLISKERKLALNKGIENCPTNAELALDLIKQLEQFINRLEQIKTTVGKSQNKRALLFETSKKAIALELKTKYAQKAQVDLAELGRKLTSLKLAMDLNEEMDRYFRTFNQTKDSYSTLLNVYLQYEAPLKIIRNALAKGEEYKSRLNELSLTPEAKAVLEKNLNQYLAPYIRSLNETLAGGPEKKLERQKMMANEYRKVALQLSANCQPAIDEFDKYPSEQAYALIVDTCKKGIK